MPVGSVYGGFLGLPALGTGLRFLAAKIYVRDREKLIWSETVAASELEALVEKLPELLRTQLEAQLKHLAAPRPPMPLARLERQLVYTRPLVMGVLNVTPDSFSDGGQYGEAELAIKRARQMMAEGADIIDIGGESTRPGATPVWEGEEAERVIPVIEALKQDNIPLSIDSRHSTVMEKALNAGAHILNDVSALTYDADSIKVAAGTEAPIILMHAQGEPKSMQDNPVYKHVLLDVYDYLAERIEVCVAAGIDKSRLIIDPGIGFGKRVVQDNLALVNNLALFHTLGCPVLLGASRKRFIGAICGVEQAEERVAGSVAVALQAMRQGVQMVRVHDVAETAQAVRMAQACHDAAMMDAHS